MRIHADHLHSFEQWTTEELRIRLDARRYTLAAHAADGLGRSCEYGAMARQEIREHIAAVRAMRRVLREIES